MDRLLEAIADRVAAYAGSACHAHDVRRFSVLRAMDMDPWGTGTLRLSVGRYTTIAEIDEAVRVIAAGVRDGARRSP